VLDLRNRLHVCHCPQCGRTFNLPAHEYKWILSARKVNPFLRLICTPCGNLELTLEKQLLGRYANQKRTGLLIYLTDESEGYDVSENN